MFSRDGPTSLGEIRELSKFLNPITPEEEDDSYLPTQQDNDGIKRISISSIRNSGFVSKANSPRRNHNASISFENNVLGRGG